MVGEFRGISRWAYHLRGAIWWGSNLIPRICLIQKIIRNSSNRILVLISQVHTEWTIPVKPICTFSPRIWKADLDQKLFICRTHLLLLGLYIVYFTCYCIAVIIWWFCDVLTSGGGRTNWRLTQFIELIQPLIGFVAFPRSPNQLDYVIISSVQFSCNNLI